MIVVVVVVVAVAVSAAYAALLLLVHRQGVLLRRAWAREDKYGEMLSELSAMLCAACALAGREETEH